ncbi:MAG: hypothetical protein K2X93_10825 [Candidatus Obscuribacterales bacterium]|nr:hypothetical protein [Candidatus Obscuribacterales bacterium]
MDSTRADLGYNRSGIVVALLSLAAGFAPHFGSVYVAPVAAFGAVMTLFLGKKQPILSILCLLVSIPGVIAPLMVPDFASPGKPAVLRLIDVFGSGSPLSQFVTPGPVQDFYGYQVNPPDWTSKFLSLSGEHGKLDKWRGRDIVLGMYELTFMVAQEHAPSNEVGSARYEWSHPALLSNISRVDSRKQEFDRLTFTINEWTASCGPINFYGFDYIATDNGAMIAFRSFDGRQACARARAEAVMKTFHRTATAGIPTKSPPVAPAIRSHIEVAASNLNAHAGKKSHHRKAKEVDHSR